MKICNTCGFECEDNAEICPTCGKSCDGSNSNKDIPLSPDPFKEYRRQIDMQIKEQEKRIDAIKQQMKKEQEEKARKEEEEKTSRSDKSQWDKTELFSETEAKEYRLVAVLVYLLGFFGIIIALLTDKDSSYLKFHINEELKITIAAAALTAISVVLSWTFVIPVISLVGIIICTVVNLISAYFTLEGKSKNAVIIRNLTILN